MARRIRSIRHPAERIFLAALLAAAVSLPETAAAGPAAKELFGEYQVPTTGPATPIGSYARGCLAGGVALPDTSASWQLMRPSRNRGWGHPRTIAFIEALATVAQRNGWAGLDVGDISQPRGGPMSTGHHSHQIGLDVDTWLRRPDRMDLTAAERDQIPSTVVVAADGVSVNGSWTQAHQAIIKAAAENPEVARIFVNPAIKRALCTGETGTTAASRAWLQKVRPWTGHDSHFHVRLTCPPDDPSCVDQAPPPPGDGCGAELDRWFSRDGIEEVNTATRGIDLTGGAAATPDLTLADLPAACRSLAGAPTPAATGAGMPPDAGLTVGAMAAASRPAPVEQPITAMYGIAGSKYLWVLPFDASNDGESGMDLEIDGRLPPGLALAHGLNGRGIVEGSPTTPGQYDFRIVGRSSGVVVARYQVSLEIEPQRTSGGASTQGGTGQGAVADFLRSFDGGSCFFARPARVIGTLAEIEAFSVDVAALNRLDAAFLATLGFEARIGGRLVGRAHCDALAFVRGVARANRPAPAIALDDVTVGAHDYVSGTITVPDGQAATLLLIDATGRVDLVAEGLEGWKRFNRQTSGDRGPNLLIAVSSPEKLAKLAGRQLGHDVFDTLNAGIGAAGSTAGVAIRYLVVE